MMHTRQSERWVQWLQTLPTLLPFFGGCTALHSQSTENLLGPLPRPGSASVPHSGKSLWDSRHHSSCPSPWSWLVRSSFSRKCPRQGSWKPYLHIFPGSWRFVIFVMKSHCGCNPWLIFKKLENRKSISPFSLGRKHCCYKSDDN
jgi:hypothetical protein